MCSWSISDICEIALALISAFAIYQYFSMKSQTKKTAATIVYNQIKSFDEYVNSIKLMYDENGNISDYHISTLTCALDYNCWNQYKHILIPILSDEDIRIIERTYALVENVEAARLRILDTYKDTNTAKSMALQFQIANMLSLGQDQESHKFAAFFRNFNEGFSLSLPMDLFRNTVNQYVPISGTTTIEKLRKIAYKTRK